MALKTHSTGTEGVYEDNLPRVVGIEVEIRKAKRYEDRMGSRGEGRAKERDNNFFVLKIYEDQLGLKLIQQPFPSNGARKLVGYFNDVNKSASARIPS
jgi:hypothetical protein